MDTTMWRQRLRDAVGESGRSQAEIARAASISKSHISEVLGGKGITVDRFLRLCDALGKHPLYVLTGIEATERTIEALNLLQQLPEDDQADLIRWIERIVHGSARP